MYHKELKSIQTIQQKFWSLAEQQPHENVTATLDGRKDEQTQIQFSWDERV